MSFCKVLEFEARLPIPVYVLLLFIAHMGNQNQSANSIQSVLSALAFFHKINSMKSPTSEFVVSKVMAGVRNLGSREGDVRLPITPPVLNRLLLAADQLIGHNSDEAKLVKAAMVLAFRAYLRIGEIFPKSRNEAFENCLQLRDVALNATEIIVTFRRFKHSGPRGSQVLRVDGRPFSIYKISPSALLDEHLSSRGPLPGLLFMRRGGIVFTRREFDTRLRQLLSFVGLSTTSFKGHSFRIGAATYAASQGKSDAEIRLAGRWSSDAFRRYIRLS